MTPEERAVEIVDTVLRADDLHPEIRSRAVKLVASAIRASVKDERRKVHAAISTLEEPAREKALQAVFPTPDSVSRPHPRGWNPAFLLAVDPISTAEPQQVPE